MTFLKTMNMRQNVKNISCQMHWQVTSHLLDPEGMGK